LAKTAVQSSEAELEVSSSFLDSSSGFLGAACFLTSLSTTVSMSENFPSEVIVMSLFMSDMPPELEDCPEVRVKVWEIDWVTKKLKFSVEWPS